MTKKKDNGHWWPIAVVGACIWGAAQKPADASQYPVLPVTSQPPAVSPYSVREVPLLPTPPVTAPRPQVKPPATVIRHGVPVPRTGMDPDNQRLILRACHRHGVPPHFALAIAMRETGGRHYDGRGVITSPAGALGIMQLMPSTAKWLGVNPYSKAQNIDGGVRYLKGLLAKYGGSYAKAAAHYNGGGRGVVAPYRETREYVRWVSAKLRGWGVM